MKTMMSSRAMAILTGCLVSLLFATGCCKDRLETEGNTIVLNPYKQWTTSKLPAYIGDLSALPQDLQNVIRQRFPRQVSLDAAVVVFSGAADLTAHANLLADKAADGAFVVTIRSTTLSLPGVNPVVTAPDLAAGQTPLLQCYSGWGAGLYYIMYDEPEAIEPEVGTPSMTEKEWQALERANQKLGDDGGVSLTDYDNSSSHNENYYQTRMDPFVEWLDAAYMERGMLYGSVGSDYDHLVDNIEQSGQRLTFNYPFTLEKYIDQATWSDPDYLRKSGSISVEFRVYPIYMLSSNGDKAGDYYGVVSTVIPHNQSMWGPYVGAHGACRNRIYGFWFSGMNVETSLLASDGSSISGLEYFERPLPENPNSSKTYSNGHTFSINGSISGGLSAGKPYVVGNFGLGGSWTSSTNYTLETINYMLDSSSPTVKYRYWTENVKLTDDWDDWTLINQNFPAPVRSEFSSHTMWVWHVPGSVVKDNDMRQFKLRTSIRLQYSTWYHWRGSVEYDSNRVDHSLTVPTQEWTLGRPERTPWGFIRLRNATDNEMAHVSIYPEGQESGEPAVQLESSYGKGEEARVALVEGTYNVVWDIVDGNTGAKISRWIYRNVKVHQGNNDTSATVRISSVDGERLE